MDRAAYLRIRSQIKFQKSDRVVAFQMFLNLALVVNAGLLWNDFPDSWLRFLAIPLLVTAFFRGFGLMHEASHGLAASNRSVNEWLGIVNGCLCFLPFEGWKKSHLQHHRWSGNVEKDPVMAFIIAHPKMSASGQKILTKLWKLWIPVLAFVQNVVFWKLSIKSYSEEPRSFRYLMSLALPLISWAAVFVLAPLDFTLLALFPAIALYLVAVEVVNLPHHLQLPQFHGDAQFPAWMQYQTARSCQYPKWFASFFALNFNYHTEHHMFPDAPWFYLQSLQTLIKEELKEKYNTDPSLKWIFENKKKTVHEVLAPEVAPRKAA